MELVEGEEEEEEEEEGERVDEDEIEMQLNEFYAELILDQSRQRRRLFESTSKVGVRCSG